MKLLFQGDSITDAFRKPSELNPAYQLGNGYAFLVASHLASTSPERKWEFVNRGVSGNTISDLQARWDEDTLRLAPDFLSLLIGVNDSMRAVETPAPEELECFLTTYRSLLDTTLARKPDTRILLMEPFLLDAGEVSLAERENLRLRQQGIAKLAVEKGLPLVGLQKVFDEACLQAPAAYWSYDGVHPTHAGFALIASAWLDSVARAHLLA